MKRDELNDLAAFAAVAEANSFTRAAAILGMSPSALSHAIKALEARLGVPLLARTTRSVSTTEAGERLLRTLRPALEEIDAELTALSGLRDRPAGTVRITTFKHAATSVIMPRMPAFLAAYPEIRVEITVDDAMTDIVAARFDAGIRFGESVEQDMIAVRVGPDFRSAVVAAPSYFADRSKPSTPRELSKHQCIVHQSPGVAIAGLWPFQEKKRPFSVKVDGPLLSNDMDLVIGAVLAGQGIGCLIDDLVVDHVRSGRLISILEPWCLGGIGYYLYYPNRTQARRAFTAFLKALTG